MRLLDAQRNQHDSRHHRQVQVAVGVPGHADALVPLEAAEASLGHQHDHVEVGPPKGAREHQAEYRAGHDPCVQVAFDPCTHGNDRLAQGDDHDQGEALGEVPGRHAEAAHPEHVGPGEVQPQCDDPDGGSQRAVVNNPGEDQEQRRREGGARESPDRLAGVDQLIRLGEDEDVQPARDRVGHAEEQRVVAERVRGGQRGHQERAHHREHEDALAPLLGGHVVREPGIGPPGPPQRRENEHSLPEPLPGGVLRHERRHLGQGEDEDQIEEELERGHPLLGVLRLLRRCLRHAHRVRVH